MEETNLEDNQRSERSVNFKISFTFDYKFWSTGVINLNFHSGEFEIEFLCFGIYIGKF